MRTWTPRAQGAVTRVLVTGADGQIGRAVLAELATRGLASVALSLHFSTTPQATLHVEGDAGDPSVVDTAMTGVDGVIHLAAIPHPSLAPAAEVFSVNTAATFTVLDQAAGHQVAKVVFASSINACGIPFNPRPVLPSYWPVDVAMPSRIADAYSLSKRVSELTAEMVFERDGMSVTSIRLPLTKDAATLYEHARQIAADPAEGVREGWSYLEVGDAARALVDALVQPTVPGAHVVLLAADDTLLPEDTLSLVHRYAPAVPVQAALPGRTGLIDTRAARTLFGFAPRFRLYTPSGEPVDTECAAAADDPVPAHGTLTVEAS